ncbi:HD-GYP domain-containing protein [Brevibacillus fluminis]|uniref:HD-GYP domain-containing protein n=2 Tax=Brevibacillus fluminis TaxID=511487 RepID=A0A3M8DTR6_9BACL|nr:HD-GYP domain-containing protein [Brevibacillus fluminis]
MLIVAAQTVLTDEHLDLIRNHRIDITTVAIMTDSEEEGIACKQEVQKAVRASKEMFDSIRHTRKIPVMQMRNEILPLVREVTEHTNVFQLLEAVKATDEYTYQHNIGVGILSTMIGKWLNLGETELAVLSLAATLHDVGKMQVPLDILNKPDKLTQEEFAVIKQHTVFGYNLLKDTPGLNHRTALVALQHHERLDGKGYPFGITDNKIDLFSRIVAVADIFHAMSSKRPYHNALPFHAVISQMRKGIFGALDSSITSLFLDNIVKKMVGEQVVLTDGTMGEVVMLNPFDIEKPLIKANEGFIDLSKESDLRIQSICM